MFVEAGAPEPYLSVVFVSRETWTMAGSLVSNLEGVALDPVMCRRRSCCLGTVALKCCCTVRAELRIAAIMGRLKEVVVEKPSRKLFQALIIGMQRYK